MCMEGEWKRRTVLLLFKRSNFMNDRNSYEFSGVVVSGVWLRCFYGSDMSGPFRRHEDESQAGLAGSALWRGNVSLKPPAGKFHLS